MRPKQFFIIWAQTRWVAALLVISSWYLVEYLHFKPKLSKIGSRPLPQLAYRGSKRGRRQKFEKFFLSEFSYFKGGKIKNDNDFGPFQSKICENWGWKWLSHGFKIFMSPRLFLLFFLFLFFFFFLFFFLFFFF